MSAPARPTSRSAFALFLTLPLLLAAMPSRAQPLPDLEFEPFEADPLSITRSEGTPRVPPTGSFTAVDGATATDWRQRIDQAWGPSPWTIPQMLGLFDTCWNRIDWSFACFQDLAVDWPALRTVARAEIEAGVSRGRFAAIMNHLALALRESHTDFYDLGVNATALAPGVPLMVVGGWGNNQHFGAGLTPRPDSSLLVYKSAPSHPLGLVPGDIVLGYGGVPWKQLYRQLLSAQLPMTGWWWGSSGSSWTHSMLMSAGLNWHLFETVDIVEHDTGDTVQRAVAPLVGARLPQLDCTEQLPIPGVPMPDYLGRAQTVSWGVVEGTSIGYVYVRAWVGNAGVQFQTAVQSLLTQHHTTGLIFDFRTNHGGNMFLAYPALAMLFGTHVSTIGFAARCGPTDHLAMCPSPSGPQGNFVIRGTAAADYDRPIAILVGPGAVSSGDQVAHLLRFHPRARYFGKSTATAFNAPATIPLSLAGWRAQYAAADAYRVTAPANYLTHDELPVDHPVWLEPGDVARGVDTVAEAAIRWIEAGGIDNRPPVCGSAHGWIEESWPPDREFGAVRIEGVNDPDGDTVRVVATAVVQDEPVNGAGDGDSCPDATIADGVARVRRERAGSGDGRVYQVSFTASDDHGGECQGTVPVCVPHDRGAGTTPCLDDGERHDATACPGERTAGPDRLTAAAPLRAAPEAARTPALEYHLPRGGWVDLGVYDVAGRRMRTLLRERQAAGSHRLPWSSDALRPGVYFVVLRLGDETLARAAVIAR